MPIPKVSTPKVPSWKPTRARSKASVAEFKDLMERGLLSTEPKDPINMGGNLPEEVKVDPNDAIADQQYSDVPSYDDLEEELGMPSNAANLESHFQREFVPEGGKAEIGEDKFNELFEQGLADYEPDDLNPDMNLLVEKFLEGDSIAPKGYREIQAGSDAFVTNANELDANRYGTKAADQIMTNVAARNTELDTGVREGMPDVDPENPLANLLDDFIYSPYDYETGAVGYADPANRILTGSIGALQHEGNHMATLNGVPGTAARSPQEAVKLFNSNDPTKDRGVWLNPSNSTTSPLNTHRELKKAGPLGHYFNTYPEMLTEARTSKMDRIYGPDRPEGPRNNTREGDMEVLQQVIDNPQSEGEKTISAVMRNLKDSEKPRFQEMWYRLGDIGKGLLDGNV